MLLKSHTTQDKLSVGKQTVSVPGYITNLLQYTFATSESENGFTIHRRVKIDTLSPPELPKPYEHASGDKVGKKMGLHREGGLSSF